MGALRGPINWHLSSVVRGPLSYKVLPTAGGWQRKLLPRHRGSQVQLQILTPHTCPEDSAPDLEKGDTTALEAT